MSSRQPRAPLLEVLLSTTELSLQFRAATKTATSTHLLPDPPIPTVPSSIQKRGIPSLLTAINLNPQDARSYHALGEELRLADAPSDVESYYWGVAAKLDPSDSTAVVREANALKAQAELLSNASDARVHVAAQKRSLAAFRRVVSFEQGAKDPAAHGNLGAVLYKLGRHKECEKSFRRAASLLPNLPPLPPASDEPSASSFSSPSSFPPNVVAAAKQDGELLLQVLHGLDMCLLQQGKRKQASRVQQLGLGLGLWRHAEQRPHTLRDGLLACGWHRKVVYGELVRGLEAAADDIRRELLGLLRLREGGDARESSRWYIDTEHIAKRPSQWLRRRLACSRMPAAADVDSSSVDGGGNGDDDGAPATCAAVRAAARWYGGPNADGYEGGLFSLLAPGSHIRPHTGPTNERIAISLGLDGCEGAKLRIGSQPARAWKQGAAWVFDDSFEHEVTHQGEGARAVLILHFRAPMLMGSNCPVKMREGDPCG